MSKEELLKEIMKLPKAETNNPISAMNSINVDDLMSAVDRLNKIPDYNDLLKENQELKKKYENAVSDYETTMAEKEQLKKQVEQYQEEVCILDMRTDENIKLINQQKEFTKYLEDEIQKKRKKSTTLKAFIRNVVPLQQCLQKYKSIINNNTNVGSKGENKDE